METNFKKTILVRKDKFDKANFNEIAPKAETEIARAKSDELLALYITVNSPLKVVDAKIYNRDVFESIFKD